MSRNGAEIIIDVMRSEGVEYVFGNPGSTEMPFIDAIAGSGDISYVMGLHESCVIAMAEGYAQATGKPTMINVHTMSGLGNSLGMLTNAKVNGAPLVVTAGHQDQRILIGDPLLSHDLTGFASTVTKWQHEPRHVDELGTTFRRAFNDVLAPPRGPVFVSIPMSQLDDRTDTPVPGRSTIERRSTAGGLDEMARLLIEPKAGKVAFVLSIDVPQAGAIDAVVKLAESVGAHVYGAPNQPQGVFPPAHPLWRGPIPALTKMMHDTLLAYDRVLIVGGQALQLFDHHPAGPVPPSCELLHLSPDPAQLGRSYPTRFGCSGDLKDSVSALVEQVDAIADKDATRRLLDAARVARAEEIQREEAMALAQYGPAPIPPMAAIHSILRGAPEDTIVVDEGVSNSTNIRMFHRWTKPGRIYSAKQIIGWGMPAAVGVALAHGGAVPVLSITSDGGAGFSPQALWTAAREKLPIVFVVLVNREYGILKRMLRALDGHSVKANDMRSVDLINPPIDFVAMAKTYGVDAVTVDHADAVGDAVRTCLAAGKPMLLEIPMQPNS